LSLATKLSVRHTFGRRIGKVIDADGAGSGTAVEEIYLYDGLRDERGNAGDHMLLRFDESEDLTDRILITVVLLV